MDAEEFKQRGLKLLKTGNLQQAVNELYIAKQLNPSDKETIHILVTALANTNKIEEAIAELQALREADPTYFGSYLEIGEIYSSMQKDFQRARDILEEGLIHANHPRIRSLLGGVCFQLGDVGRTLELYEGLVDVDDPCLPYETIYRFLIDVYTKAQGMSPWDRVEKRIPVLERLLEKFPNKHERRMELADDLAKLKRVPKAISNLEMILNKVDDSEKERVRDAMLTVYEQDAKNYSREIIAIHKKRMAEDPNNGELLSKYLHAIGICLPSEEAIEEIKEELKKIRIEHPELEVSIIELLGRTYLEGKNYKKAIEVFENMMSIFGHHYQPAVSCGISHYGLGNLNDAEEWLTTSMIGSKQEVTYNMAARVMYQEAAIFMAAIKIKKKEYRAAKRFAQSAASTGYNQSICEAFSKIVEALEEDPVTPHIRISLELGPQHRGIGLTTAKGIESIPLLLDKLLEFNLTTHTFVD